MRVGSAAALTSLLLLLLMSATVAGASSSATVEAGPAGPAGPTVGDTLQDGTAVPMRTVPAVSEPGAAATERVSGPTTNTSIVIEIESDGDARWIISTTFNVSMMGGTDGFAALAEEYEAGNRAVHGLTAFERTTDAAEAATGRSMAIVAENRTTTMPTTNGTNATGTLTLSFTWRNFAAKQGGRIHVGDAFDTTDPWFEGLEPHQVLTIKPPSGYGVVDSNVPPTNGSLRWTGPASFSPTTLEATFTGNADPGTPAPTPTPAPPGGGSSMLVPIVAVLVLLGSGIGGGYLLLSRPQGPGEDTGAGEPAATSSGQSEATPPTHAGSGSDAADQASAKAGGESGSGRATPGGPETGGDAGPEAVTVGADDAEAESQVADDGIDTELLSDEERVERLLEQNGGRMKQASIVKETGWSNAKVSQLLSSMDEADQIDKLRIGRENLISFPEEDVTDIED